MQTEKIRPRPFLDDAASISAPIRDYYICRPLVKNYLAQFSTSLNVERDFELARAFLTLHSEATGTFGNYRNFMERLLLWSWIYGEKSVLNLTSSDFKQFVSFNKYPPENWISDAPRNRFVKHGSKWVFNEHWRPISLRRSKADSKIGIKQNIDSDSLGRNSSISNIGQLHRICSSFYNFLIGEGVISGNPIASIKRTLERVVSSTRQTGRGLTIEQWGYVIEVAEMMADEDPKYERTLFIVVAIYSMYLRGSDLSGNRYWTPTMGAFVEHGDSWWFELVDRYDVVAKISVRPDFIPYLIRYRRSRNLPPLPPHGDTTPLLTTIRGRPGLTARHIRDIVQEVFDRTYSEMKRRGRSDDECIALLAASVSWLRDTGARIDAPHRNPIHLQKDLRHVSLSNTLNRFYSTNIDDQSVRDHGSEIKPKSR
jgi:hypothetical protein